MKELWLTSRHAGLLGALLLLPLAAAAGSFTNGNFESPGITVGTQDPIYPGHQPTGWVAGGTASIGAFQVFYENGMYGVVGKDGPNVVGFGGNGTTGGTLSQTFDTVLGQTYTVNYWVTDQQGVDVQSVRLDALGLAPRGSVSYTIPNFDTGTNYTWHAGTSLSFIADGSSSTIRFTDTTASGFGANWGLDGVTVNGVQVGAIPEPGTYGLLLAGLGFLGFVARRRSVCSR